MSILPWQASSYFTISSRPQPAESIVKSTLVEPLPDPDESDDDLPEIIRADSVRELAEKTNIGNQEVLDRVLLPGKRFGAYHILGFVAAGGMGEIYAAQRVKSDGSRSRPVALKVITGEYAHDWRIIERFKREARISKAIRSRHVARVYEFGESPQGHVFMAMELLDGEELFDRLHRRGLFSPLEVADITLQILKGLHRIHDSGFVHRDIKPENIFFAKNKGSDDEDVKILDFGIAKEADKKSDPLLSVAGQIYGTPQYIAPEQAINPDVDHRADLYSLGVLMYECVTGSLPFDGQSSYDIIVAHQKQQIPPLPSTVDPEFADIVSTTLAKSPDERFQSAIEMGRVLKRWRDETSWVDEDDPSLSMEMEMEMGLDASGGEPETLKILEKSGKDDDSPSGPPEADYAMPAGNKSGAAILKPKAGIGPNADTLVADETDAETRVADDPNAETRVADDPNAETRVADETDAETLVADNPAPDDDALDLHFGADETDETDATAAAASPSRPTESADANTPSTPTAPADAPTGGLGDGVDEHAEDTLVPPPDSTTEFRSPHRARDDDDVSDTDARNAQVITGVALGLLVLAILWALFL